MELTPDKHVAAAAEVLSGIGLLVATNSSHLHWSYLSPEASVELKANEIPVISAERELKVAGSTVDEFVIMKDQIIPRDMTTLEKESMFGEHTDTIMSRLEEVVDSEALSIENFDIVLLAINIRDHFMFDRATFQGINENSPEESHDQLRVQTTTDSISRNLFTENRKRRILRELIKRGEHVDLLEVPNDVDLEPLDEEKLNSILLVKEAERKIANEIREAKSRQRMNHFPDDRFPHDDKARDRRKNMSNKRKQVEEDDSEFPNLFPSKIDDGYHMLQPRNRVIDGRDLSERDILVLSALSAKEFFNRREILASRLRERDEVQDEGRDYYMESMLALQRRQLELNYENEREALESELRRKKIEDDLLNAPRTKTEIEDFE